MEIEHNVFAAVVDPEPGMARKLALTARMTVACHSSLSGKRSHLCLRHSTYQGRLDSGLCIEIVQEFLYVHPTYETININISEAFEHYCWNPKHDDCDASQERRLVIFAPPAQ